MKLVVDSSRFSGQARARPSKQGWAPSSNPQPATQAPHFSSSSGPLGRRMSNAATRSELLWAPRYDSFQAFFAAGAPENCELGQVVC